MCPFLPRISCISFYFPYSLDKASPTLFCAFTSHVIAATSEILKSPSDWLCALGCVHCYLYHSLLICGCLFSGRYFPSLSGLALLGRALTATSPKHCVQQTTIGDISLLLQWLHSHRQCYPMEFPSSSTSVTLSLQLFPPFQGELGTWRVG